MSDKAKTYIAPNSKGWNGSGATPKSARLQDEDRARCATCGEPLLFSEEPFRHVRVGSALLLAHRETTCGEAA